jgi:NADPH-dependent 2,4-dienoyl-CoA reductase/sulfur reductase-like enzyme
MGNIIDVVIVGGGVAGVQAAVTAKQLKPSATVALISHNPSVYPWPDPIAAIEGSGKESPNLTARPWLNRLKEFHVTLLTDYEATSINPTRREIQLRNASKQEQAVRYKSLVISTGSTPSVPPVKGSNLKGVFSIKWLNDALALARCAKHGMAAYVVGGGVIGLEVAESLTRHGLKVSVIELLPSILNGILEPDLAESVKTRAQNHGIRIYTNSKLEEIGGVGNVEYVQVNGQKSDAGLVVFAAGMRPNSKLAADAGVAVTANGAIQTGTRMETNLKDIYATGDCAESIDLITSKPVYRPCASIAAETAKVASSNAVGIKNAYSGFLRTHYANIFGLELGMIGLSTYEANNLGINAEATGFSIKHFPPSLTRLIPSQIATKTIIEKKTDTLIGIQVIGFRKNIGNFWMGKTFHDHIKSRQNLNSLA